MTQEEQQPMAIIIQNRAGLGQRLFEELRDAGYDGGVSILRDQLRRLRPGPKKTPIVRFETQTPGFKDKWTGALTPSSS